MRISDWSSDVCSSDLPPAGFAAIRAEPWDPQQRHEAGAANFHAVMMFGGPPPATAYFDGGILNFVFVELWMRPGLEQRARRWITLLAVSESSSALPLTSAGNGREAARERQVHLGVVL